MALKGNMIDVLNRRIISLETSLTRQRNLANLTSNLLKDLRNRVLEKIKEEKAKLYK